MDASTEYWFKLRMEAATALSTAKQFKKELINELKDLKTSVTVNLNTRPAISQLNRQIKSKAPQMVQPFEDALAGSIKDFDRTVKTFGAAGYTEQFRSMWTEGIIRPSALGVAKIREAQAAMTKFGESTRKMGVSVDEWANMGGVDQWITAIQAAQRRIWGLRGFGYQMENYARTMIRTTLAVGAAAGVAGREYLQFADPLNRAARNLDLNIELTDELSDKLRDLNSGFEAFTPEEQAEGLYLWAAATGAVIDSSEELDSTLAQVEDVQKLAKLGAVSYGQAVEGVTDVLSQYQKSVDETSDAVAILVKVAAVSKAEVGDLTQAFSYAGARADQANTSFEETAAALQLLSAFGLRGSRAGRALGMLFDNLIAPSDRAREILDGLFEDTFGRTDVLTNAQGQFVGLTEAVRLLNVAMEGMTQSQRDATIAQITNQNAGRALIPLLKMEAAGRKEGISVLKEMESILTGVSSTNRQTFIDMMQDLQGYEVDTASATDTLDRYWEQYENSVTGRMDNIRAKFSSALSTIGEGVMDFILPYLEKAVDTLGKFADMAVESEDAIANVLKAAGLIGAAGVGTMAAGRAIRIVADVKTLLMAKSMKNAANTNMKAATMMLIASENQIRAASLVTAKGAASVAGVAGSASDAALVSQLRAITTGGTAAAAGGGGALSGVLGFLAGPGAIAAVIAGVLWLAKTMRDLEEQRRDESASLAASTSTYDEYLEKLKEIGTEKYAVTRRTYDLIQAQKDEDDVLSGQKADEYAQGMADAEAEVLKYLRRQMIALSAIEEADEERIRSAVEATLTQDGLTKGLLTNADQYMLAVLASKEIMGELGSQTDLTAGTMKIVADEAQRLAFYYQMLERGEGIGVSERPPEDLAYGYMLVGDSAEEAVPAMQEVVRVAKTAEEEFDEFTETLIAQDQELRTARLRLEDLYQGMLAAAQGSDQASGEIAGLIIRLQRLDDEISGLRIEGIAEAVDIGSKRAAMSLEELLNTSRNLADQGFGRFEDLAGILPDTEILGMYDRYLAGLTEVLQNDEGLNQRALELKVAAYEEYWDNLTEGHRDAYDEMTESTEDAMREQERIIEQAQAGFRNLVSQALQPTTVTQEDMWATDAGDYKDKWDEQARRMRSAMEDPNSEWRKLMIPEDVLMAGESAIKNYGSKWLDSFYAGLKPDQIDWDAFVDDFEASLEAQLGQEALVDTAIAKLAEQGITATSADVMAALGLQSPIESMLLGGKSTEQLSTDMGATISTSIGNISIAPEDTEGLGTVVSDAMMLGIESAIDAKPFTITLADVLAADVTENAQPLKDIGGTIGDTIWSGIEASVEGAKFVDVIVDRVMGEILEAIGLL